MTNPAPGLALAVIGANPPRTKPKGRHPSRGTAMPSRARHHATTGKKTRRNPNALYWKVGPRIPWKPWRSSPQALQSMLRSNDVNLSKLGKPQRVKRATTATKRQAAPVTRAVAPVKRAAAKPAMVIRPVRPAPIHRATHKRGKQTKRNPPGMIGGIGDDFAGLGAALSDLGKHPKGILWIGGGAAGTIIAGGVLGAQLGRVLPAMQPGMARLVNAATYAGTAVALSRLPRDPLMRRQLLAGGLAVALWELAQPGATAPLVAKIPGLGPLVQPSEVQIAVRTPALQANPAARAAVVTAAAPWYRQGGKVNPLNWFGSGVAGDESTGIPVDGIAGDDGSYQSFLPPAGAMRSPEMAPGMQGDLGCATLTNYGTGGGQSQSSMAGTDEQDPVLTLLGDLSCPSSGRSNELTQLVNV